MSHDLYYAELNKNHKWNSVMNILDGTFFQMGFVCFIPAVFIVAYLKHYTDNEFILNLPVFIANFMMAMGPFVMSFYSGRIKRKKRAAVMTTLWHCLSWLPVILVVYFLSGNKTWIVPAFLIAFTVFYIVWGISVIFWQELMGRALAPDKMTSAMGMREFISKVVGFLTSLIVVVIMGKVAFPNNFLVLFSITFVCWLISLYWVTRLKEAPYDETVNVKPRGHFKNLLQLPAKDKAFRWYSIFTIFLYGHLFVGGLYTVVGIERFKDHLEQDQLTGIISIVTTLSASIFAFSIGKVMQKMGRTWGFAVFTSVNILLPIAMSFCYNYYFYLIIIFFSGIIYTSWILEFSTIMGFSAPERRHEYIAVSALVKLIPIIIYTNLGGYLADAISPMVAFVVSAVFCLAALLILLIKLRPFWEAKKQD